MLITGSPSSVMNDPLVTYVNGEPVRSTPANAGVPVHFLRKIAGHGSLTTTQRYLHSNRQTIEDAGAALSLHLNTARSPSGPRFRAV